MGAERLYLVATLAGLLSAAMVSAAAVWDHSHPGPSTHEEWVAAWYCSHLGRRCDEPKPWHEGWHQREPDYMLGVSGSMTVSALFAIASIGRLRPLDRLGDAQRD